MHVVDEVQGVNINACQPVHSLIKAWSQLLPSKILILDRTETWSYLLAGLCINTTVTSIEEALSQVGTSAEELHLLTGLSSTYTAADAVIVAPNRTHNLIILILDRAGLYRDHGCVLLEVLGEAWRVEHGEVWLGRRTHVLQSVEETVVVLCNHVASVHAHTTNLECSPNGVAREELVVRWDTSELNHAELHYQVVDELLSLGLGKSTLFNITCNINVKEC